MFKLYRLFLISTLLCISGCATIINGTTQKVSVFSAPSGATLTVVGESTNFTTPCQVELTRKSDHILKFEKAGYDSSTVDVKHVLSGAVAGNIILGGLIGWGVDAVDGAQYRLMPETVNVTLKPAIPGAITASRANRAPSDSISLRRNKLSNPMLTQSEGPPGIATLKPNKLSKASIINPQPVNSAPPKTNGMQVKMINNLEQMHNNKMISDQVYMELLKTFQSPQ